MCPPYLKQSGEASDERVDLGLRVQPVGGSGGRLLVLAELSVDLLYRRLQHPHLLARLELDRLEGHKEGLDSEGEGHDREAERLLDADT